MHWREKDYLLSCVYANRVQRERAIREGRFQPRPDNEEEMQWAREGVKDD